MPRNIGLGNIAPASSLLLLCLDKNSEERVVVYGIYIQEDKTADPQFIC